jgi:hypothetical protein
MESKRSEPDGYEALFLDLCRRVEKWLLRLIAAALVLLIASQALMQIPLLRSWISRVDRLEGVPYRLPDAREVNGAVPSEGISAQK